MRRAGWMEGGKFGGSREKFCSNNRITSSHSQPASQEMAGSVWKLFWEIMILSRVAVFATFIVMVKEKVGGWLAWQTNIDSVRVFHRETEATAVARQGTDRLENNLRVSFGSLKFNKESFGETHSRSVGFPVHRCWVEDAAKPNSEDKYSGLTARRTPEMASSCRRPTRWKKRVCGSNLW